MNQGLIFGYNITWSQSRNTQDGDRGSRPMSFRSLLWASSCTLSATSSVQSYDHLDTLSLSLNPDATLDGNQGASPTSYRSALGRRRSLKPSVAPGSSNREHFLLSNQCMTCLDKHESRGSWSWIKNIWMSTKTIKLLYSFYIDCLNLVCMFLQ